jgi:hypothetical protein
VRWDKHFADRNPALSGAVDRRRRRVCVRRLRISEIYLLDQQRDASPRLKPEDLGDACTEERMSKNPAACLMNRSFPT